jgi:hypothetical protein
LELSSFSTQLVQVGGRGGSFGVHRRPFASANGRLPPKREEKQKTAKILTKIIFWMKPYLAKPF